MSDLETPQPMSTPNIPSAGYPATQARLGNGMAVAALVLGIVGFFLTGIPFFVGFFLGGIPNVLAIIFGITGIVRGRRVGRGTAIAIVGLILGGIAFISMLFGAGTIW
jgi:hypothetical protein